LSDSITAIFALRLKAARDMRGMSQRALGGIVSGDKDKGSVLINRYEREVRVADMETATKIARALDVPLAYLFAESEDQAELLLAFAKLTKAERAKVVADLQKLAGDKQSKARKPKP
jgi:transcriptional regulator with XRE-family HTH domain